MKLREYQLPQVTKLVRQLTKHNQAALVSAVGSGKSLIAGIVGNELLKLNTVSKVIIASPYNTIVNEFCNLSGTKVFSGNYNNKQYLINDITRSYSINHLSDVITGGSSEYISTSHSAMADNHIKNAVTDANDLSDLLFIIDEAHHCVASDDDDNNSDDNTILGEVTDIIKAKGGKVMYVTATPYRVYKGKCVLIFDSVEANPVIRSIGTHQTEGYAPPMDVEYTHIKNMNITRSGKADIFGDKMNSSIASTQLKVAIPHIQEKWLSYNCPKTIINIPQGNSMHSARVIKEQLEQIELPDDVAQVRGRKHPSVLISVGPSKTRIEHNGEELTELEYDKAMNGRVYDIVIGCRRFNEGTDVPSASHFFMIGLPSSARLFHQRTGRILRSKDNIEGYAEWFGNEWVNNSKVIFFAPTSRDIIDFDYNVGRQLLHCIYAAESYNDYCNAVNTTQNIRIGLERECERISCKETKETIEYITAILAGIELTEEADDSFNKIDTLMGNVHNPNMTFGERLNLIKYSDLTSKERSLEVVKLVNTLPIHIKENIDFDAIVKETIKLATIKDKNYIVAPTDMLTDIFEEVLVEFNEVKVSSNVDDNVHQVFSRITGITLKEWSIKCAQFTGEEYAIKKCMEIIEYYKANGKYPSQHSNDPIVKSLGKKLVNFKLAKQNKIHTIFYPSLQILADENQCSDMFNMRSMEQTMQDICMEIINYYTTHGKYPSQSDVDSDVRALAKRLSRLRLAKLNNKSFYPSLQSLADKHGCSDMFDVQTKEQSAIENTLKIIEYVKTTGKYPSDRDPDKHIKSLANKLFNLRKAKRNVGSSKFYSSLQVIAEERNLPNMFNKNWKDDL